MLTQAVMNETDTNDIIRRGEIKQQMFKGFVTFCVEQNDQKETEYLQKCQCNEIWMGDKMVKIIEERGPLQRFIGILRSWPELNLKECVEIYEFGAVSRSLFASGGFRLLASDKASILHYLEKLDSNTQQVQADRN